VAVKLEKTEPGVATPFVWKLPKLPGRGVAELNTDIAPDGAEESIGALREIISSESSDRSPASVPESSESKLSVDSSPGGVVFCEKVLSSAAE
jgi:hypothetical protein